MLKRFKCKLCNKEYNAYFFGPGRGLSEKEYRCPHCKAVSKKEIPTLESKKVEGWSGLDEIVVKVNQ